MSRRVPLAQLPERFDLVIVGGGISGAGILREAVRTGASVLLVEQGDFAAGTSSASSKLVHGGLRYLRTGEWRLTLESVRERQRLLEHGAGLVEPQPFLLPVYRGRRPGKLALRFGLWIYDRMARESASRWIGAGEALALEPDLSPRGLLGALLYEDAWTDDARLVLRLLLESAADGAVARNYTRVESLLSASGRVHGVALRDEASGETREIRAGVVINATGAWTARAPEAPGAPPLRPLRGSHLVFARSRLPLRRAVSWAHPRDGRPVFAYPWEGATLVGTTDVDHGSADPGAARMTRAESEYLLEGVAGQFPGRVLAARDALSCYAGVRPVVSQGKADPSAESRDTALWSAPGVVGVTGGKLTTFRVTARRVLEEAARQVPALAPGPDQPVFLSARPVASQRRVYGRLGVRAGTFLRDMPGDEQAPLSGTPYSLAELRWGARHEHVQHLDDLLLRRTRLGLLAPGGGDGLMGQVRAVCEAELGWDPNRWRAEEQRYRALWRSLHAPEPAT